MVPAKLGGIYAVADDPDNPITKFPTDNLPEGRRTFHPQRYVLVVQADALSRMPDLESVLVVPLSTKGRSTPVTVEITPQMAEDIPGVMSVALVHLTQPILKQFLIRKVGQLDVRGPEFTAIRATFCKLIGLI